VTRSATGSRGATAGDAGAHPELDTPAVLVDLDTLERNVSSMAARAERAGVKLRPHTKTHRSAWIARRQLEHGARGITVAKLGEAEVMLAAGFTDQLIAYPIVGDLKLRRLRAIAERAAVIVSLDSVAAAEQVATVGRELGRRLPLYVDVDSGLGRCGLPPGRPTADLVLEIARLDGVEVVGLMTHAGHAYRARSAEELRRVAHQEAAALAETAEALRRDGLPMRELSVGSTPTAHHLEEVAPRYGVTEARPGTYVFMDANQVGLGVASEEDCALTVLASVVSRPVPDRAVLDAGSKTLGADGGGAGGYGRVRGCPEGVITLLNEEHAVVRVPPSCAWRVGDRVEVIPAHACIPPNLTDELIGTRGGAVVEAIRVDGRGRSR
jgi:D-serine deaminase-like pyridoxal phosphate-dependent protein